MLLFKNVVAPMNLITDAITNIKTAGFFNESKNKIPSIFFSCRLKFEVLHLGVNFISQ